MVMVPGSAEDERRISALNFVKSDLRSGLTKHLGPCLRLFSQRLFTPASFPYAEALKAWKAMKKMRGRYLQR